MGAAILLFAALPARAVTMTELFDAVAAQPGVTASALTASEANLRHKAAIAALFPQINAFGKAEIYNSPTNVRPMPPTEVNVAAGESLPFSREIMRYGLTLDMPLFVKSLLDLQEKSEALAVKARLGLTLKLVGNEAAVVAANGAYHYMVNLNSSINARLTSLAKTKEDMARMVQTGRAAQAELLKIENSINELEIQQNELAARILDIRRQLETITGLTLTAPAPMVMAAELVPAPYLEVRIAKQETLAARQELERRSNARWPSLHLSGTVSGNEGTAYNTDKDFNRQYSFAALTLKIPLFDQTLDVDRAIARTQLKKAEKYQEERRAELAALERNLKDKLPVIEQSRILAGKSLENRRRLLKIAQVAHESGRTTTEEYLRYESQVLAAQAVLLQAENEKWQIVSQLAVLYGVELKGVIL